MATKSCAIANKEEPETCVHGCKDMLCCLVSQGGEVSHLCLLQLDKSLGREPEGVEHCGGCKDTAEESK